MKDTLVFTFERGGEFGARFLESVAPETIGALKATLPLERTLYHTRWCGREVNVPFTGRVLPPRENQTSTAGYGDVVYWREWDIANSPQEALAVYYGPEVIRHHTGLLLVNVFARVPQDQWPVIEQVGLRVWQKGVEQVRIRME